MDGECVTYPVVAVLLGYTCDVLQRWKFPQAKFERNKRSMEKRKSHACVETVCPLWEYELAGTHLPFSPRPTTQLYSTYQVSSGVSVAYFSSIVLLVLAASTSPSSEGHGDTSTYFDSVVFLTMFLLAGMPFNRRTK